MGAAVDVMAAVLLAFFLAGIAVGVVVVIALSVHRQGRADRRGGPASRDQWPYLPPTGPDDDDPDPRRWPERGD
jgi:hypothetical protein